MATIRRKARRRGSAMLEFVMTLPLFLALVAAMFSVAGAGAMLLNLQRDTRRAAWSARYEPPPRAGLGLGAVPPLGRIAGVPTDSGLVVRQSRHRFELPWLRPGRPFEAEATREVLAGSSSWDQSQVRFRSRPPMQIDPKFDAVARGF